MNEIGMKNLCAAVVKQACIDYLKAIRYLDHSPKRKRKRHEKLYEYYSRMKDDCERFFKNEEYFSLYCDIDGEYVMKTIQEKSHDPDYKICES